MSTPCDGSAPAPSTRPLSTPESSKAHHISRGRNPLVAETSYRRLDRFTRCGGNFHPIRSCLKGLPMAVPAGSEPPVEAGTGQLLAHLRSVLPGLAGALRQVGNVILEDPAWASRATIVELGERSGTSPATVTRFCRTLGLGGYTELRVGIATDIGRADQAGWEVGIGADVLPTDPIDRVLRTLLAVDLQAMHETAAGLDLRVV